ncbi:MAG: hypothetical protein ABIQ15_16985 [Nocardioides sp.]
MTTTELATEAWGWPCTSIGHSTSCHRAFDPSKKSADRLDDLTNGRAGGSAQTMTQSRSSSCGSLSSPSPAQLEVEAEQAHHQELRLAGHFRVIVLVASPPKRKNVLLRVLPTKRP